MKHYSVSHLLALLLAALLLSACAGTQPGGGIPRQPAPAPFSPLAQNPDWYLAQLAQADAADRFDWQLLATRSLIAAGDIPRASGMTQRLAQQAFTPRQKSQYKIVAAQLLELQGQPDKALSLLANMDLRPLDSLTVQAYLREQASLLVKTGAPLAAAKSLMALDYELGATERPANQQQIWSLLQGAQPGDLRSYIDYPPPNQSSGWFELAALVSERGNNPAEFNQALRGWKSQYPNHPGLAMVSSLLPKAAAAAATTSASSYAPRMIAVFVPLSSNLAFHGQALRQGMEDAVQQTGLQAQLRFYDSASQPIPQLYQQAKAEGADFIIGPLLKNRVEGLLQLQPDVPTLLLNEPEGISQQPDVYYFALSPEGDAAQAALRMHQDGRHKPLLILPQGPLGQRTADGFSAQWQALTGGTPTAAFFSSREQLQATLRDTFGVEASQRRIDELQTIVGQPLTADPRSRQDVDALFLLASPLEVSTVTSLMEATLNPLSPRPAIYLGPKSNTGDNRADVALALNGMQLGDMPWMLNQQPEQKQQLLARWPNANADLLRLYAMGFDAISLVPRLPLLRQDPASGQPGLTGELHVRSDGVIERRFYWARYENGQLVGDAAGATDGQ